MTPSTFSIPELIAKHLEGGLLPPEEELLNEWLMLSVENQQFLDQITNPEQLQDLLRQYKRTATEAALSKVKSTFEIDKVASLSVHRVHFLRTAWFRYAAAILVVVAVTLYIWTKNTFKTSPSAGPALQAHADIPAGKQGAILMLADGRQLVLDGLPNGSIANQQGVQVLLQDGRLIYSRNGTSSGPAAWNTVTTPKGRQFQLTLPDGSRVWLNAASSIRYPAYFAGLERLVETTGEVYMEVTKSSKQPFKVKVNDQTAVDVLGTSLNINSYANEGTVKTTLLDGSVRVNAGGDGQLLRPNQQAVIGPQNRMQIIDDVNTAAVLAWKNGIFDFRGQGLAEVMRQLERWYDIEVEYEGGVPDVRFAGKLSKGVSLNSMLRGLQESGVHCTIDGRRLIVKP